MIKKIYGTEERGRHESGVFCKLATSVLAFHSHSKGTMKLFPQLTSLVTKCNN